MKATPIHYGEVKQFPQGKGYVRLCDNQLPKDDFEIMAKEKEDVSCKNCLKIIRGRHRCKYIYKFKQ